MISGRPCRHLIITGGRGYIGSALVDAAVAAGHQVTLLGRGDRNKPANTRHIPWRLGEELPHEALASNIPLDDHAVIHLAHDWRDIRVRDSVNFIGTQSLRDSCRQLGIGRFVFISSQSAREDALNAYGRVKWNSEQLFDRPNEISIRVGLVYGGPQTAQYGLLCRIALAADIMPMVAPSQLVQPIHRQEVVRGIMLALDKNFYGTIGLADPYPISFSQFLDTLAWRLRGGRVKPVPLPFGLTLRLCRIAELLPFMPQGASEKILGLAGTRPMATNDDLSRLGLQIKPVAEGMLREPAARRALLTEGRAFLSYILRRRPGAALIRRYARAIEAETAGAMRINRIVIHMPWTLRFLEPFTARSVLAQRLRIAATLSEASPEFTDSLKERRVQRLAEIAYDLIIDALTAPIRVIATVLWR